MLDTPSNPAAPRKVVYIVDDDQLVLRTVRDVLGASGLASQTFSSAAELLAVVSPDDIGCVVTDLQMPGMNGLELQQALIEKESYLSLIMLTGHADVPVTVEVMKRGAITLIEKPFKIDRLSSEVKRAMEVSEKRYTESKRVLEARALIALLSEEELAVLDCAAAGKPNKAIGSELSMSSRTVDRRRHTALKKLQVDSVSKFAVIRTTAKDEAGILDPPAEINRVSSEQ